MVQCGYFAELPTLSHMKGKRQPLLPSFRKLCLGDIPCNKYVTMKTKLSIPVISVSFPFCPDDRKGKRNTEEKKS